MDIKPIKNETDYDAALQAIDGLMGASQGTPEADALEVLVTLVEGYEKRRWPVDAPDPVAMIEHVMEARGYRRRIWPFCSGRNRMPRKCSIVAGL